MSTYIEAIYNRHLKVHQDVLVGAPSILNGSLILKHAQSVAVAFRWCDLALINDDIDRFLAIEGCVNNEVFIDRVE